MADRATGPPGRESSRQRAIRYYTFRVLSLPTEPLAIQPKQTLYPRLLSLSKGLNNEMSGILFDLNELLYARPNSKITARAIIKDFLDAKCRKLKDYDFLKRKEKEALSRREEREEIRRLREEFLKERSDIERNMEAMAKQMAELRTYAIQSNERLRRSTLAYSSLIHQPYQSLRNTLIIQEEPKSSQRLLNLFLKGYSRIFEKPRSSSNKNGLKIIIGLDNNRGYGSYTLKEDPPKPKSIPDKISSYQGQRADFPILAITDEKETEEISKEIEDTDTERRFGNGLLKDLGSGNEPLKDLERRRTIGNYIGNPVPIRPLAKHSTLAYGTLSAFNDDRDDFLELRATDPHLKAKELALFARSFPKELKYSGPDDDFKTQLIKKENPGTSLSECFEKLAKELKGIQGSLRPGLKDDRSLADKLYLACKNVLKITIARMNLAFTSTAAVANIRRAIAFAIKTSRPFAKARAYASFSEPHDHTCS
ncbi:hypothetical protein MBM_04932 [Drepanopeziza brunnea f. sp. 'multigermtubi' MB_m1]|uniref:Uncharacterized protein n=1 Tax=Marssonina brunnea f. sp. multigermtubi (strain MB_m1) TaxID=1072389 RepID=K1X728_MARBU|nr:uncharacterized protein MBM_04932 [Drepanopeziza brunnea f. sp. 'multigermtubi' MB_m1]EKD16463.1 hypothetical protein MBM_04932 [Drepanopeziza brunnea f. sp. 'multigermtubi' MB_m1]